MRYSIAFTINLIKIILNTKLITKKLPSEQYASNISIPRKKNFFSAYRWIHSLNTFKFRTLKGRVKQFRSKSFRLDYILFNLFLILLIVTLRWILLISKSDCEYFKNPFSSIFPVAFRLTRHIHKSPFKKESVIQLTLTKLGKHFNSNVAFRR